MPQRSSPKSLHHNDDPNLRNRSNDVAADASDGLWQYFHLLGGVAYTLLFSLAGCYVSVQVVNSVSPRHALDGDAAILACLVGSVALGLSTTSILSQLSPPSQRRSDSTDEGASVHDATRRRKSAIERTCHGGWNGDRSRIGHGGFWSARRVGEGCFGRGVCCPRRVREVDRVARQARAAGGSIADTAPKMR